MKTSGSVEVKEETVEIAQMMSSQDKNEVLAVLFMKWSGVNRPLRKELQLVLQRWFIRNHVGAACLVLSASTDGRVVVKITPARGPV